MTSRLSAIFGIHFVVALVTLAFHPHAQARETGFETGNEFHAVVLRGNLAVNCSQQGQYETAFFDCSQSALDPVEFARFVTDQKLDADQVSLKVTHEDGSVREKSSNFDGSKGASTKRFNLWIATLFQRPLLNGGKNTVAYTLLKDGTPVKRGSFVANVTRGKDRYCPRDSVTSYDMNDCRSQYAICDQYFQRFNYCE